MWRQRSGAATPCRSEGGDPLKGPRQAVGDPAQTAGPVTSWREAAGVAAQPEPEDGAAQQWGATTRRSDLTAVLGRVFGECRRVLRPGGCLYVSIAVAAWPGRPVGAGRLAAGLSRVLGRVAGAVRRGEARSPVSDGAHRTDRLSLRRALRRLLTQAGFFRVQAFYIDPSYHHPWGIIPARRGAVLVYERRQSARVGLRWWLAWLGLHPLLYGSHMFVAYTREPETQPAPRRL